jgi:aminoglycoside phosphotransferase (APT) family kinase protein
MPSPTSETRTLDDLIIILVDLGVIGRADDLVGAELLVGWEGAVVRTCDGWIYRFGRKDQASFLRELEVLALVEGRLGVATPHVDIVDHSHQLMAYRTIAGAELDLHRLLSQSIAERQPLIRSLANVLASMHSLCEAAVDRFAVPVIDPTPMIEEVRAVRLTLGRHDRAALDEMLVAWERSELSGEADQPVLLHGDFHFGNMVFSDRVGPVTGIWDFSCTELGDPSVDLRYVAGDSTILAEEIGTAYAAITGRPLDVSSARLMSALEAVSDAVAEQRPLGGAISRWSRSERHTVPDDDQLPTCRSFRTAGCSGSGGTHCQGHTGV